MPYLPLPADASPSTLAAELTLSGLDLIPAGVAAAVLTALGTALVITAMRRSDAEREALAADDERALRGPQRVDA
ncbi:hypothetical protein [Naasia sp. SYSU D00948]|uniref:hypothetical protein n=1 Tax=Naasia sp. SYSU D00948 TaxID=2817379 RepID=UPI001B301F75|nr:hypothetical protein [Naasia sp. SYSU D00948]